MLRDGEIPSLSFRVSLAHPVVVQASTILILLLVPLVALGQLRFTTRIGNPTLTRTTRLTRLLGFPLSLQIFADTGANVITKGVWYPDKSMHTEKDPPLYLHITAVSPHSTFFGARIPLIPSPSRL